MEKYDILTLDDNKEYAIVSVVDYENDKYMVLNEIDENEEVIEDCTRIVKYVVENEVEQVIDLDAGELPKRVAALLIKDTISEE